MAELDTHHHHKEIPSFDPSSQSQRTQGAPAFPDESALADHIQTLLQAIDRLRDERDGLKRALEFSEVEYRITIDSYQTRISSLTKQLTENALDIAIAKSNPSVERRMKRSASCAAALAVVISNLQVRLDLSEGRLSATSAELASSNSRLFNTLAIIDSQKLLATNAHEHDVLLQKFDAVAKELSESDDERDRLRSRLAEVDGQVATIMERARASEAAGEDAHQNFLLAEQRLTTLNKNCQDVESERNSLALQVTNLQDDLARVQEDLVDAQDRYNTLHAQQLSAMSTSEVVRALKDRIKELEMRILNCTDQIGDYQHDIRRLEANAKLHEERIIEMTSELELLASQKEAMVEDCAEAREARDEAIDRLGAIEEEAERILQQTIQAHEAELSAMSSTMANLTSENQQTTARLAKLETENAGFVRELDSLSRDHHRLSKQLNVAASRSCSLELENSEASSDLQQSVISLAVIHRVYKDCARRLQESYQRITSLELQLGILGQELQQQDTLIEMAEKEKHDLLKRLSDVSAATDGSQDDSTSYSRIQTTTEELSSTFAAPQQREGQRDDAIDFLRNSLQEKELELEAARKLLEETKSHQSEVEAELLERITTMTVELQAQAGQAEELTSLRVEIENVRTQLQDSRENFADLDKLHGDVIQDFLTVKDVFERRLTETEEQIRTLEADYQRSQATVEASYRHEADILTSNLEDRDRELDELRQQLQGTSEAYTRAEAEFHEELESYRASRAVANDLEKDLRRTVADIRRQLAQAEAETLTLQEERQILQAQITGLQAEVQRSTSLTRYLESQVRERWVGVFCPSQFSLIVFTVKTLVCC